MGFLSANALLIIRAYTDVAQPSSAEPDQSRDETRLPDPNPTDTDPDCFVPPAVAGSTPVTINGGASNPNPAMRVANISRSDSVVTVPIFDATIDPCPWGTCGPQTATVIGFLQLGIQSVSLAANGTIGAYILNAAGCGTASANPVVGGGVSPVPVRLTQ
jgi:hypothetical protein